MGGIKTRNSQFTSQFMQRRGATQTFLGVLKSFVPQDHPEMGAGWHPKRCLALTPQAHFSICFLWGIASIETSDMPCGHRMFVAQQIIHFLVMGHTVPFHFWKQCGAHRLFLWNNHTWSLRPKHELVP
jgi:hypothetical protein